MTTQKKKRSQRRASRVRETPPESQASDAMTVCWVVTLTTLLLCDLSAVAAHVFVVQYPDAQRMAQLRELLLFAGSVVGVLSLLLLPVLYRIRRVPPPTGLVVFGACVAVAPILAVVVRILQ